MLFISSFLFALVALPTNSQSQPSPVEKPAQSDLSDAYYALDRILNVDIKISPTGWDSLRAQTRTLADILGGTDCLDKPADDIFSWFNATVTVDGVAFSQNWAEGPGPMGPGPKMDVIIFDTNTIF